ncbi:MAG: heavy-metal-associated domain-containing protein [Bacteroidota bacterium]|nr:heavy-metal-associated domain-containing protein [Bacteroidota bacterium]
MVEREFHIEGMTCNHCVAALRRELENIVGLAVKDIEIGTVRVEYDPSAVNEERIRAAVNAAGYSVRDE